MDLARPDVDNHLQHPDVNQQLKANDLATLSRMAIPGQPSSAEMTEFGDLDHPHKASKVLRPQTQSFLSLAACVVLFRPKPKRMRHRQQRTVEKAGPGMLWPVSCQRRMEVQNCSLGKQPGVADAAPHHEIWSATKVLAKRILKYHRTS